MKIHFRKFILSVCIFFMGLALLAAVPGAQAASFRPEKSVDGAVIATSKFATVMQVILNAIDHGMTIREAVDAPRVHLQWIPDELRIEKNGLGVDTAEKLAAMGYKIQVRANMGDVNAIMLDSKNKALWIASDPRNEF
jgi:gamma-glutamyltranspeptidase